MRRSHGPDHFTRLYDLSSDPWNMTSSAYERAKYRHTIGTLGNRHFPLGLEVGCSIGVLTKLLAGRCNELLAVDIIDAPLTLARARCADLAHVRFARMQVPGDWPGETFDLIVLSELLYFLAPEDVERCARHVDGSTRQNSIVLLVNWLGQSNDPCTGDEAAEIFIASLGNAFHIEHAYRAERYRIDRLARGS